MFAQDDARKHDEATSHGDDGGRELVPLGKAAALLGVHTVTLRRWSDGGKFPVYKTPGGHRRYDVRDILDHLGRETEELTPEDANEWAGSALDTTRQMVAHSHSMQWLGSVTDTEMRSDFRKMGRRLLGLLFQFVAADEPDRAFIDEAAALGRMQAQHGIRAGMSLTSLLEATLFFRDILVESSMHMPKSVSVSSETNLRVMRRINQLMNAIQLSVADAYEETRSSGGMIDGQAGASR